MIKYKIIVLSILTMLICGCMKEVKVRATILEHTITADRYGERTYVTVVKTDDGYVQELTGMSFYGIPVGKTITITVNRSEE